MKESPKKKGILYLCATPIGNMRDITLRVIDTLGSVDAVACEDTRQTRKLFSAYKISKPLLSYREANSQKAGARIISMLMEGRSVALVSDAGMPGVSDPGADLVKRCIERDIEVRVVPGANAALAALVLSGLPTDRFAFEGFLPKKESAREKYLREISREKRTLIFHESPLRLVATLRDMLEVLGDRRVAVAKELTKRFETVLRGRISEVMEELKDLPEKGEFVIVLEGNPAGERQPDMYKELEKVKRLLSEGYSLSESVKIVTTLEEGVQKKRLYDLALREIKPPEEI